MKVGMLRSAIRLPFLPAFLFRDVSGADLFRGVDAPAKARCGFHSAFAGALDILAATKGFGHFPMPSVICYIDRRDATDVSCCKIISSPLHEQIRLDV
jgi:hypothetical protein